MPKNDKIYLYYRSTEEERKGEIFKVAQSEDGLNFEFYQTTKPAKLKIPEIPSGFKNLVLPRADFFDSGEIFIQNIFRLATKYFVFYHVKVNESLYRVGYAVFDMKKHLIERSDTPIWESSTSWEGRKVSFIGLVYHLDRFIAYWNVGNEEIYAVSYPTFKVRQPVVFPAVPQLTRSETNPLVSPLSGSKWEEFTTFNPAAIYAGGRVHILYRAQGFNYVSVVGYASSPDGIHVDERLDEPIYIPRESFEYIGKGYPKNVDHFYSSGGGYGGIEDPRATIVGDRIYMVYVAHDGVGPPRVAMTSIALSDFLDHRWLWEKPVLISPPGVVDKSCVIFPEKIKGKYVIMHRIFPDILIDFEDDLSFDGKTRWLPCRYKIPPRPKHWDSRKIGAGAPPLKTKDGWLLIYYATCDQEGASRYMIGAMLLELDDPTKVICRSSHPILTPEAKYENEGFKAGVVYPCGAVIIGQTLFVYYGGADSYVCVATADLDQFLDELKHHKPINLVNSEVSKVNVN
ncbi:MAG TPA: hypothetical protein VN174_04495 [Candidatus Methanoperedens sp.]|nr:hypothetical protein [Candidatus Methanoperedens sp.]